MNDDRAVEEMVTKFILNTCRLRPQFSQITVQAVLFHAMLASIPTNDGKAAFIPLTTGSVAEFYIEPMLPHIGDVDVMFHLSTSLAIPRGHPPPTQLPAEFHNYVQVHEIIDSHLPGYVYLQLRYLLTECIDDGKFSAVGYEGRMYLSNNFDIRDIYEFHGPALRIYCLPTEVLCLYDAVRSIRCLVWLPQASDWPARHRNYGWPDSATVDCVVSNGCDVVAVAHRQCRQHEWMSKYQHRLSFSRAEIVLINSWMPVQQIIYHILRVFMKTDRLTENDNPETGTLSNYHIKTLMLWACELKPRVWWSEEFSLVKICASLLHELAVWLAESRCSHYFINNQNLFDSSFNYEKIRSRLTLVNETWLSSWFVNNYIRKCAQLCPYDVLQLFDDVSTITDLQNAVSAVVDWRQNTTLMDMYTAFQFACYQMTGMVSWYSLTVRSLACWLTEFRKISYKLSLYFLATAFLHVARRTSINGLNDELMDVLAVLLGQSIGPQRYSSRRSSVLLLSKAVNLMKAVGDIFKSHSTVQLIATELSKAYLYRALSCEDSDSDSIYCVANIYLAVLYHTTGQYQTAIDHCTLVMRSQDHSQCSSHVVQGELLPKTDDNIDIVLGLAAFYQHVRMTALNQQQQQTHVIVFTTELFAHYLHIRCVSVTKCQQLSDTTVSQSSKYEFWNYLKCVSDTQQPFITDVLLWKLVHSFAGNRNKFVHKQQQPSTGHSASKYPNELNTTVVVELLQKAAVEHLTTFRQIEAQDYGSIATIVTTDFEALYAFKCGQYQHCLHLCRKGSARILCLSFLIDIWTFPEFIQLADDYIVSLTALTLIVNPKCRSDSAYCSISQPTLTLYLATQCQLKLHHSVTSVAGTLECIKAAYQHYPTERILDRLILKMIAHRAATYITTTSRR